mgnify:CR=1 FL=1
MDPMRRWCWLRAKSKLPSPMFHYIDGGADDEWSKRRNTTAFDDYSLMPNQLRDVSGIDLRSLGNKPQDWALAALAALAKTNRIISMDMLRAALTTRFRNDVLASAVQLVEKVYKN